jgi:putative membrane protein
MTLADFPALNASLNALTAVFLGTGFVCIMTGRITAHRRLMSAALATSVVFLGCYLTYHYFYGSTKFTGTGWTRPLYFSVLLSHTILAVVMLPMILRTFYLSLHGRFEEHKKLARWTWPIWMYVSLTGVLVYAMLYQWFR